MKLALVFAPLLAPLADTCEGGHRVPFIVRYPHAGAPKNAKQKKIPPTSP